MVEIIAWAKSCVCVFEMLMANDTNFTHGLVESNSSLSEHDEGGFNLYKSLRDCT